MSKEALTELWEAAVKLAEDARPRECSGFGFVYEVDRRDMIALGVAIEAAKPSVDAAREGATSTFVPKL